MAARRMKFKPKPLVGLVRRNKDPSNDQANASVINADLIDGNSQSPFIKDESSSVSENCSLNERADEVDKSSNVQITNNKAPCNNSDSTPVSILVKNCNNLNDKDCDNSQFVDDRLKSDINHRIKTVIANNNSCSNICNDSKDNTSSSLAETSGISETAIAKNLGTKGIAKKNSHIEKTMFLSQQNNSSDGVDINKCHSSDKVSENITISEDSRLSSKIYTNVVQNEKSVVHDNSSLVESNESNLQNADNDKVDAKSVNTASKLPSRFGKNRFKPVLSTVVRKKDSQPSVKKEEILPEIPVNANSTDDFFKPVENNYCFANNEKTVEKENIDKNIGSVEEIVLPIEKETVLVTEKSLPVVTTEEPAQSKQNDDVITPAETENEAPTRSPVKLFQPKKRQRSQGNSLSNMTHKALQEFKVKFKDGNVDKSKLMMRDLIFYNPKSNPMSNKVNVVKSKKEPPKNENNTNSVVEDKLDEERVDDIDDDESESSVPVPQVKVGPDGKIILDPKSLVIETTGIQKERANLEKSEIVQENEFSFSKFQKRKVRRSDWSAEETLLFYKALNDLGADFSLMQSLFPKKTRRDLKLKFKKEERMNVNLIDKAMRSTGNFDFAALEIELKKDREERDKKIEEQRKLREEKKQERLEKKNLKPVVKRQRKQESGTKEKKSSEVNDKKKNSDKIKRTRILKINKKDDTDGNKKDKKVKRHRKKAKKEKESDEEEECDERQLCFVDVSLSSLNVSSDDDGIVSDFMDEGYSNEHDDLSDIASLNAQIFKRTRSGRKPKSKLLRGDSLPCDDSPRPRKKLKKGNRKQTKDLVSGYDNSALNTVLTEAVEEFNSDVVVTCDEEIQAFYKERFERCYQLLEEPLDLSNPNLRSNIDGDDVGDENNYHDSNENVDIVEDVGENTKINDCRDSGFVSSAGSSESDLGDVLGKERNLNDSLQIVEELTSATTSEMDCGVILVPEIADQYILPVNRREEYKDNEKTENCTDTSDENKHIIYSLNDDEIIVNEHSDDQNIQVDNIPIIINNLQPMPSSSAYFTMNSGQQIQVISQEQINYILKQNCNAILPDHDDEDSSFVSDNREADTSECISHSSIHCYPSSDHTYTSLTPKPVEPKTLFIVTQMNPENTDYSQSSSTIIVYPSGNNDVPS